jgi:hypothetical protein
MNNELKRFWKEMVVARFEVLSLRLPGGNKENHERSQSEKSPKTNIVILVLGLLLQLTLLPVIGFLPSVELLNGMA